MNAHSWVIALIGLPLFRHDRLISGDFLVLSVRPVSLAYELYTRFFSQP